MCSLFPNLETPKVRVICNYIVRLEISAAEIMHTFQKEQHLGLKTFESAESAESASPFQTSPDSKRVVEAAPCAEPDASI